MTFSKSDSFKRVWQAGLGGLIAVSLCPASGWAQTGKAETVSVSPYARQNSQQVFRLPSHGKPPVRTVVSKTGSVPGQPHAHTLENPRGAMPSTPSLTPSAVPRPPVPVVAQKPVNVPKELEKPLKNMSIADVIDNVVKAAPDVPPPDATMAAALPVETIKTTPAAEKPALLSVTTPEPTPSSGKAHQPSQQDIARLGDEMPRFYWPLRGNVMSTFGAKGSGKKNDGVNITAPKGTAVRAAASGLVVYSGQDLGGLGNLVLVRHSGGYHTAYAHVANVLVKTGDKVAAGEAIANVGKSGNVIKPQLHFEIRDGRKPVDPERYLPKA